MSKLKSLRRKLDIDRVNSAINNAKLFDNIGVTPSAEIIKNYSVIQRTNELTELLEEKRGELIKQAVTLALNK